MRRLPFALILPAALLLASAAPNGKEDGGARTCSGDAAEPARIEQVQADFAAWEGRCVRMRGIAFSGRLFASRGAILDKRDYGDPAPRRSIAFYLGEARLPEPGWVEIAGRLGSCETAHQAAEAAMAAEPGSITWASGFCHSSVENYLRIGSAVRLAGKTALRFTETELAERKRPLIQVPAAFPGRNAHVEAARALAGAVAARDEAAYLRLLDPALMQDIANSGGEALPGRLADRLAGLREAYRAEIAPDALLATVHPVARRQERLFGDRSTVEARRPRRNRNLLITCWCRTPDCTGRWPVMAENTDNHRDRPFVCVHTENFDDAGTEVIAPSHATSSVLGLAEPGPRQR